MTGHYTLNWYVVPPLLVAMAHVALSVTLLVRERASRAGMLRSVVSVFVAIWLVGMAATFCSATERDAVWAARFAIFGTVFVPPALALFSSEVLRTFSRRKAILAGAFVVAIVFAAATLGTNLLVAGAWHYSWGYYPRFGALGVPFVLFIITLSAVTRRDCATIDRATPPGNRKQQLRLFSRSLMISGLGIVDVLPAFGIAVYPFGYLPLFICMIGIARVLTHYRLVDIVPAFAANQILAAMGEPLAVCDDDGIARVVNEALCSTLGYRRDELLGRPIEGLADADSGARQRLRELLAAGAVRDEQMLFRTSRGEAIAVSVFMSHLQDDAGRRIGTILIAHDMRERQRTEVALRLSEEKYRTILETIEEGYYEVDLTGALTFVNDSLCRILGRPAGELVGMNNREFMDAEQAAAVYRVFREVHRNGEAQRVQEWEIVHANGTRPTVEVSVTRIIDAGGRPCGFRGVVRDITARKLTEAAIQHAKAKAEAAVGELQSKNAELDAFVHTVSHDLKAPLLAIEGMASAIVEDHADRLDEQGRQYLNRLQANVAQMKRLIADLLMLSRVGREDRLAECLSLGDVLNDLLAGLMPAGRSGGIDVAVGDMGTIHAVRAHVEQLFGNLISNAIKYMGDTAAPRIEIGRTDRGTTVEYWVRDNGIGIDPDYHAKVFEMFQRLKEVEREGTGVGLAIVKKIVEGAGGRIWVESTRGQGATFRFTWPATPAP